jgi:hypothetical protein
LFENFQGNGGYCLLAAFAIEGQVKEKVDGFHH